MADKNIRRANKRLHFGQFHIALTAMACMRKNYLAYNILSFPTVAVVGFCEGQEPPHLYPTTMAWLLRRHLTDSLTPLFLQVILIVVDLLCTIPTMESIVIKLKILTLVTLGVICGILNGFG
eukprot:Lithocolla_globosa_v1_NODE_5667_length_1204_cov_3.916449.p2 type:complete len:122 gc:universal NODE_5667_length_1204_cov_3.916449:389-754(+)